MATRLEKFSVTDARVDMSQEFKKWISQLGAKEANLVSTPSASTANNTSSSFNVQLADNTTCVIDRSSVDLVVPLTIVLSGSAVSGADLYNPAYEGFRSNPIIRIMKKLDIRGAGGQAASYEPYRMIDAMECFTFDGKQRQTEPDQIDNCQTYASYNGTASSPFAPRFSNPFRASRRAMSQIAYTPSATPHNLATLTTTLKVNLQDFPPFTNEVWHTGMNAQPLKIDISWYDFLSSIWCRDTTNHPQNTLTGCSVTLGQPTLNMVSLTLPSGQQISDEQNFPYHQIDCQICQTVSGITAGTSFVFDTGVQQLDFIPSRVYLFAKPSEGFVTASVTSIVSTPNCFAELVDVNVNFANRSGIFNNYNQEQLFQMAKSNGLIPLYCYCDWLGEVGANNTQALRGSILAADLIKDVCNASKTITTGLSEKCNLQLRGHMKNCSASTRDFDIVLVTIYDGVFSIINRNMGMANLGLISSISELKPLDIPFAQALAMMGGGDGGDVKSFFKGLWNKIKEVVPIIKKSGVVGNVMSMIPYAQVGAPLVKSLGWGEGEGMDAFGEGGRKKKTSRTRRGGEGGYLM